MTIEVGMMSFIDQTNVFGDRVYPKLIPQEVDLPACAVQRISGPRDHTHSGPSGLAQARMQVTGVGSTYQQAKERLRMLRTALDGYSGPMGNVMVGFCHLANEIDGATDYPDRQAVRQIYQIGYSEDDYG